MTDEGGGQHPSLLYYCPCPSASKTDRQARIESKQPLELDRENRTAPPKVKRDLDRIERLPRLARLPRRGAALCYTNDA